jgi:hypothetical protein
LGQQSNNKELSKPSKTAFVFFSIPANYFDPSFLHNLSSFPAPVSDAGVTIRRPKPSKSAGLDCLPGFKTKACLDIFVPVLKYNFKLSLSLHFFLSSGKQSSALPILRISVSPYITVIALFL